MSYWSQDEINILRDNAHLKAVKLSKLIDRSPVAISFKKRELGVKSIYRWSKEEIKILKTIKDIERVSEELNIDISIVRSKAKKLGIKQIFKKTCPICNKTYNGQKRSKTCKKKECKRLYINERTNEYWLRVGRNKSRQNKWTTKEDKILKDNAHVDKNELSKLLNRSPESISQRKSALKIKTVINCENCGVSFEKINQNRTCPDCTPSEEEYAQDFRDSPRGRFHMYRSGAKKRKIKFELTLSNFETFFGKNCFYCNGKIKTVGIDRLDNKKHYKLDNIVMCCGRCNEIKMDLSVKEMLSHIKKVLKHKKII
jgi:hypothetical protein